MRSVFKKRANEDQTWSEEPDKLRKVELRIVAVEIGLVVNEGMKKSELRRLIADSDVFKNDNEAVKSAVEDVLENRNKKSDQDGEIEIERLKN
ncbi:hypothetical protein NPIL_95551 [Nephila pilipes]|uniref:Uncharacterized protein n=1 Tax=Nephila pilipes TaxID=299642 RepID=A0A8X6P6I7_NEPPI|nr:hypothetical protein NPIL_95551 [Nephila pilipes]